jgi:hypothetical protein
MGMTLRTITDHRDLLALDQVDIGIAIIINAHFSSFPGVTVVAGPPTKISDAAS